jgi:hypothetical protein
MNGGWLYCDNCGDLIIVRYNNALQKERAEVHLRHSGKQEAINQTIGALSSNFILAIAPEIDHQLLDGLVVEQEKSKFGQYLYSFEVKANIKIIPENVLVSFPIICNEEEGRFQLT